MKKIILCLLLSMSLYAFDSKDIREVADKLIDCYNRDKDTGLLVYGDLNVDDRDSLIVFAKYLEFSYPYEFNHINKMLGKYIQKERTALFSLSCSAMLNFIAKNFVSKARDFFNRAKDKLNEK